MPTPSGFPTSEDLQNAQKDVEHLGRVVNSEDAQGNPIASSTNRTGGTNKTLDALQAEYQSAIQAAGGVPLGTWASGVTYNAYNEYLAYNGIPYKPSASTTLPYTTQGSDPTNGPDAGNVVPFAEVQASDLVTVREDLLGSGTQLYMGDDGESVKVGDTVPAGTTHLRVENGGTFGLVKLSELASGNVSSLFSNKAVIGGVTTYYVVNTTINDMYLSATDYGISESNTPAENAPIFLSLLNKSKNDGGVIVFPSGTFNLGVIEFEWENGSGDWYSQPVRGIVGAGVNRTNLIFDNPDNTSVFTGGGYWITFKDFSCQSSRWSYNTNYNTRNTEVKMFDMVETGCPRLSVRRVKASGFSVGFSFHSWVSVITQCEAFQCAYGFIYATGTSMTVQSNYAIDCWYGHVIGAKVYADIFDPLNDATFERSSVTYSKFSSLACDRPVKSAYVIGTLNGSIDSCGSEIPYDTASNKNTGTLLFPTLVDSSGTESVLDVDGSVNISQFYLLSNISQFDSGDGVVNVERNNCRITVSDVSAEGFRDIITFGDNVDTCFMDLNGRLNSSLARSADFKSVSGVRVNGDYIGDVVLVDNSLGVFDSAGFESTKVRTHYTRVNGDDSLRFSLKGTEYNNSSCMVKLDIASISGGENLSSYLGSVIIKGFKSVVSGNQFAQYHAAGNRPQDISVSVVGSVKNQNGLDIKFQFVGDSANSSRKYVISCELITGAQWSDGDYKKYLIYKE